MTRNNFFNACFALSVVAASFGCGSDDGTARPSASSSMETTLSALERAVAACGDQRDACEANLGDATVDKSCVESFRACKKSALDDAMPELGKGVQTCSDEARACRKEATDDAAKLACQDALKACVSDFAGEQGKDEDAGSDEDADSEESSHARDGGKPDHAGGAGSPVASCTSALRTCIEGDEQAKVCTDQLRTCLDETLPNRSNGQEHKPDAGKADEEHGNADDKPEPGDRGMAGEHPSADAGVESDREKPSKDDAGRGKPEV